MVFLLRLFHIFRHLIKPGGGYQKPAETVIVGDEYNHKIELPYEDGQKELLPDGLTYENDELTGFPTGKSKGRFKIRIIDREGYINEEFDLIIKNKFDSDPPSGIKVKYFAFSFFKKK